MVFDLFRFAFVEYGSEAEAVKAMEQYQGADLDGREISIERCSEKQGGGGGGNWFVHFI